MTEYRKLVNMKVMRYLYNYTCLYGTFTFDIARHIRKIYVKHKSSPETVKLWEKAHCGDMLYGAVKLGLIERIKRGVYAFLRRPE